MQYTLHLHNATSQLYLNKAGGKKDKTMISALLLIRYIR